MVDLATQMVVADELFDGKPWVDLSEEELLQGLKRFAGVDIQQTSDEDFCRRIFRVLKMDASVPADSRVFMQKRALRNYLADSGLTEVARPDGRQYTLKHGKVLVEAIAAGIEPLELRRKVEKNMPFDLLTHDPGALFSIIAKQRRDQAVIEANDAVRRQTAKRRDARSVAAAGTKPQGSTADGHDSHESAKAAGVKAERNRRYDNKECFVCGKQGHKQWDCPQSQQGKAGNGVHGQSHGQTPTQQQQSINGPAQHTRSKTTGMAPASATRASAYKTASKAVVTETEPAVRLNHLDGMTTTTCTFACHGKGWRQWIMGSPRWCSTRCLRALGHRMQRQFFTPFRCSCRHPRRSSHVVIPAQFHTRVSWSYSRVEVVIRAWIRWRPNCTWRP